MKNSVEINEERLLADFTRLAAIDSESYQERKMADALTQELTGLGFTVCEDDAGAKIGGNAGNLYAFLPGELPGEPILFSGHMDTVKPGIGKQAVIHDDGRITSCGDTVLGSDDLACIAPVLEGVRAVLESRLPHRDLEIVFSVCEELYCEGIKVFDFSKLSARHAYVLDMSGFPGAAALSAPTILSFEAEILGKSAHAGFEPEKGIHAIRIMSEAIAALPQGHLDSETTFNIGYIGGGSQTNIVPASCICRGEVRSSCHETALAAAARAREVLEQIAAQYGASCRFETKIHIRAYQTEPSDICVRRFQKVCGELGLSGDLTATFGGSDNNVFAQHGITGIVLSCGMNQVHTVQEYTSREELAAAAQMAAALCLLEEDTLQ